MASGNVVTIDKLTGAAAETGVTEPVIGAALKACEVLGLAGIREHFQRQESPDGKPWAKMAHDRPEGGAAQLLRDKGLLLGSISGKVTGRQLTLRASHPGARVHQFGATITPVQAKMLAIPLTVEAKRAGSPRQFGRKLFILKRGNGRPFLAEAANGTVTLHYILVGQVTIPARPYMGFSDRTLDKMEKLIADLYSQRIAAAFQGSPVGFRVLWS